MTREEAIIAIHNAYQYDFAENIIEALKTEPCDAVSREAVNALYDKYHDSLATHVYEFGEELKALPPVTPKQRTGKWLFVQRGKCVDMCCNECKSVRIKDYAYNYTVDQITEDKENMAELFAQSDMQYCPNCGAKMEGESE